MSYSTDKSMAANLVTVSAERVFEIIALNKRGIKPARPRPELVLPNAATSKMW